MQRYKTPLLIFSILLATLMPLYGAVKAHKDMTGYPIVKFDIEPYDPRDLLYGHYMTFQINWNWKKENLSCAGDKCCLCVSEGNTNPEVSAVYCPEKNTDLPSCRFLIPGNVYSGFAPEGETPEHQFDADINRYYVDERFALPLEDLFRQKKETFAIGLGMKPKGKPVVEKLYVGGKPLDDYVASHGGTIPEAKPLADEQQ